MKNRRLIVFGGMLAAACAVLFITRVYAQSEGKADPRIKAALDKLGYKAAVTELGNYRMTFNLPKDRKQMVFIASRTESYGFYEVRKIWGVAHKSDNEYTGEFCRSLLKENVLEKIGTWEISFNKEDGKKVYRLKYVARVPADLPADKLRPVISAVMLTADKKEASLSRVDGY